MSILLKIIIILMIVVYSAVIRLIHETNSLSDDIKTLRLRWNTTQLLLLIISSLAAIYLSLWYMILLHHLVLMFWVAGVIWFYIVSFKNTANTR